MRTPIIELGPRDVNGMRSVYERDSKGWLHNRGVIYRGFWNRSKDTCLKMAGNSLADFKSQIAIELT